LVLLVRSIACAAVAIALAKPYMSCSRKGPQVTRGPQAAILVIDDSFAAGYLVDGRPWLKSATDEARRVLTQLGPEAEGAIGRAPEGAEPPTELTRDHLRLRDQLLALEPSARPADTTRALGRAAQLLAASSHVRRTVFLISLLARTGLRPDDAPWGKDGPVLAVSDLRQAPMPNFAITSLRVDPDPGAATRGVAFDAEVGNSSDAPSKVELSLAIADRVVARGTLAIGPGERKTKHFLAALPPGVRATDAQVALSDDGLAIDDRRWVRASLRDRVRVLIVDGDPRTVRHDDEVFYLEAALRPGDREDSGTSVRVITVEDLAGVEPRRRRTAGATQLEAFDGAILA